MMGSIRDNDWDDEEYSVIGDKGELGFIDFEDDRSMCSYNEMDEGVVTVSVPFTFIHGKPQSVFAGETTASSITIKNTTEDPVELWSVKIFCSNPENSFTLSLMEPPSVNSDVESMRGFLEAFSLEDRVLQPYQSLTIWLSCKPKDIGLHTTVVHFDVGDERIERVVFLLAEDKISQSLASNRPFKRTPRSKRNAVSEYVAGSRPSRATNRGYKNKLAAYAIPEDARELLESKKTPEALKKGLTKENYASYFRNLLIMEEIHMEEEMRNHDMERVTMKNKGRYLLALEVPGLAERRPSLVHGDYVFASLASEKSDDVTQYQGYIHRVEADEVFLRFANEFHLLHQDDDLYNISFTYNRVTYRRLYQAVDAAEGLERELLFPSLSYKIRVIKTTAVVPLTRALNEEQMRSVEMILGCKGAPPYVIYGPPGTGKTVTLVEAILQLYTTRKNTRILVCASSNSAADHILEKIISKEVVEVQENEIFRLNAPSRQYDDMQPDKIHFCFFENFIFKCPPLKALLRYRIIVSTYASAHLLHAEGVPKKHFTHVFLDEAGQASEPETMITISNLCRRETVVVLAGDPQQLGPVVFSREADIYGLGKSYLQRLFDTELYSTANENFITKLVRNYRCHPAILELPSQLFYNGELIACKEERCYSMDAWLDLLPNKEFPVLFVGIQGCDEREGSNPSWFNRIEASKVVEIIKKLRSSTCLTDADIGVITPYRQQVLKLKRALETLDMPDIKVGSVEQFQGLERQVIIISTVRSTVKHNEFDRTYCLGFLSNHRRFNVAVTRAISLLIIVGNPHIISKDPYWNKLLRHCSDNGSYQGCPLPERQDDADKNPFEEDNLKPSEEAEWGDSFQAEEIPKPVPDEAEWSDGWK